MALLSLEFLLSPTLWLGVLTLGLSCCYWLYYHWRGEIHLPQEFRALPVIGNILSRTHFMAGHVDIHTAILDHALCPRQHQLQGHQSSSGHGRNTIVLPTSETDLVRSEEDDAELINKETLQRMQQRLMKRMTSYYILRMPCILEEERGRIEKANLVDPDAVGKVIDLLFKKVDWWDELLETIRDCDERPDLAADLERVRAEVKSIPAELRHEKFKTMATNGLSGDPSITNGMAVVNHFHQPIMFIDNKSTPTEFTNCVERAETRPEIGMKYESEHHQPHLTQDQLNEILRRLQEQRETNRLPPEQASDETGILVPKAVGNGSLDIVFEIKDSNNAALRKLHVSMLDRSIPTLYEGLLNTALREMGIAAEFRFSEAWVQSANGELTPKGWKEFETETQRQLANLRCQQERSRTETETSIEASQQQMMECLAAPREQLIKKIEAIDAKTDKHAIETANLEPKLADEMKMLHEALSRQGVKHEHQLVDAESKIKDRVEIVRSETRDAIALHDQHTRKDLSEVHGKMRKQANDMNNMMRELRTEVDNQREQLVETTHEHSRKLQALEEENQAQAKQTEVEKQERQKTEAEINQHFEVQEQRLKEMEENGAERGDRLEEEIRNNQRAIQEERRQREDQEQQLGATLDNVRTHMSEVEEQRQAEFRQLEATLTDNLAEETRERGQAMTIQRQKAEEIKVGLEETKEDLETLEGKVNRNKTELQRTMDRLLTTSESYGQKIRELRERQTNAEEQNEVFKRETLTTVDEMNSRFQRLEDEDRRLDRESRQRESNLRGTVEQEQQQALDVVRQEREQLQTDLTSHIDTVRDEVDRNIDRVRGQVAQQGEEMASMERKSRKDVSELKQRIQQYHAETEEQRIDELMEETKQVKSDVALLQRVMKQLIGNDCELVPMQDSDTGYETSKD